MKLKDIARVTWKGLKNDRKRNIITIIVMSIIFVVIFIANFWLQGFEDTYLEFTSQVAGGKSYGITNILTREIKNYNPETAEIEYQDVELQEVQAKKNKAIALIESYGGVYVGEGEYDESGKLILPTEYEESEAKTCPNRRQGNIGSFSYECLERSSSYLLNPILNLIPAPKLNIPKANSDKNIRHSFITLVFELPNSEAARNLAMSDKINTSMTSMDEQKVNFGIFLGAPPEFYLTMNYLHIAFRVASIILVVVALIVTVFTSIRLVDNDKKIIALYRSLGASAYQIRIIYTFRFLLLTTLSAIFAIATSIIIMAMYSIIEQSDLTTLFSLAFRLDGLQSIFILGINVDIAAYLTALIASSGICTLVNLRRLR
ncbi:hypothetical protein IJJ46_00365 [Candidatus Saccharibacteria bacterium]|nr:hypothetical protein [Candidatus Saccharibacteria bacterium]